MHLSEDSNSIATVSTSSLAVEPTRDSLGGIDQKHADNESWLTAKVPRHNNPAKDMAEFDYNIMYEELNPLTDNKVKLNPLADNNV